ncbi:FAD-binding oxidoreductase [Cohnella cellulosilytica]|uniref:FAD-binding oxidoreductase n=1 Tax=Cohnella cellulosilytica TaxID=986710 RepID=A0ABW2FEF2_9BACL
MFELLQEKVSGSVLLHGDGSYETRRSLWNAAIDNKPAAVVVCWSEADIAEAVRFAADRRIAVSMRAGGHHVGGTAAGEGALMLDLSGMNKVEVDPVRRVAVVEAGATLGDVDRETQKHGLAVPTGTVSKTGIAGLTLNGGLGYLRRKYGLTCDHLIGARLVTANGETIEVGESEFPELLWALRGGGGNFGVVSSFVYRLQPVGPEVLAIDILYDYADLRSILTQARDYAKSAPDEVTFNITATQLPPAPFLPEALHNRRVAIVSGMYAGSSEEGEAAIGPLRRWATPIADQSAVISYEALQQKLDPLVPDSVPVSGTSLYFAELDDEAIDRFLRQLDHAPTPAILAQLWPLGGQMNRIAAQDTAFANRDASFVLLLDAMAMGASIDSCREWTQAVYADLLPFSLKQSSYLNGIAPGGEVVRHAFGGNFERLRELKRQWDPDNRFRHNHNIDPQ